MFIYRLHVQSLTYLVFISFWQKFVGCLTKGSINFELSTLCLLPRNTNGRISCLDGVKYQNRIQNPVKYLT